MGLWHIYQDPRFKSAPDLTPENREALRDIMLTRMQERTLDEWMAVFIEDGDVAAEPFLQATEGMLHPQYVHNGHAVMVGDSLDTDVEGALAAGLRAVLVDRWGAAPETDVPVIASLGELPGLVQSLA